MASASLKQFKPSLLQMSDDSELEASGLIKAAIINAALGNNEGLDKSEIFEQGLNYSIIYRQWHESAILMVEDLLDHCDDPNEKQEIKNVLDYIEQELSPY